MTTRLEKVVTLIMRLIMLFIFTISPWVLAKSKIKDQVKCDGANRARQDCLLSYKEMKIHIWKNKIFLTEKSDRAVVDLPFSKELDAGTVRWDFASLITRADRNFIQIGIWSLPEKNTEVESLHWVLYEVRKGDLVKVVDKVVQKRKKLKDQQYKADKPLFYGIEGDSRQLYWKVANEKGKI